MSWLRNPFPERREEEGSISSMPTLGIMRPIKRPGRTGRRLVGSVDLKHVEITMKCDSAHLFPDRNQVRAFSRIHMNREIPSIFTETTFYYDGAQRLRTFGQCRTC